MPRLRSVQTYGQVILSGTCQQCTHSQCAYVAKVANATSTGVDMNNIVFNTCHMKTRKRLFNSFARADSTLRLKKDSHAYLHADATRESGGVQLQRRDSGTYNLITRIPRRISVTILTRVSVCFMAALPTVLCLRATAACRGMATHNVPTPAKAAEPRS